MSTPDEISTVASPLDVTPSETKRQEYELTDPVTLSNLGSLPTTSRDHTSNTAKQETISSYYAKWRFWETFIVETSSANDTNLASYFASLDTLFNFSDLTNAVVGTLTFNTKTFEIRNYVGVKFDLEYKFTIYSSSQQQGALIFYYYPGYTTDTKFYREPLGTNYLVSPKSTVPSSAAWSIFDLSQLSHKIVSFGAETEVIMRIPYSLKYDFIPIHSMPRPHSWGSIGVRVFDPLLVRSGTYDKVSVRVETRVTNLELIGPNFYEHLQTAGSLNVTNR